MLYTELNRRKLRRQSCKISQIKYDKLLKKKRPTKNELKEISNFYLSREFFYKKKLDKVKYENTWKFSLKNGTEGVAQQ